MEDVHGVGVLDDPLLARVPRRTKIALALAAALVGVAVFAATSPHPWAGKLTCDLRGGRWTNRFGSSFEEIVTSGYRCVDV